MGRSGGGEGEGGPSTRATRQATVTRVVDGDTIVLRGLGRSRLIGVDTPELHGRRECFGAQASAFTARLLSGKRVSYALGAEPRDRYGRALVYVWLADGRFFNALLVSRRVCAAAGDRAERRLRAGHAAPGGRRPRACGRPVGPNGVPDGLTSGGRHGDPEVGYAQ